MSASISGFCYETRHISVSPDGMLVYLRVAPAIKFAGVHFHTVVEKRHREIVLHKNTTQ